MSIIPKSEIKKNNSTMPLKDICTDSQKYIKAECAVENITSKRLKTNTTTSNTSKFKQVEEVFISHDEDLYPTHRCFLHLALCC